MSEKGHHENFNLISPLIKEIQGFFWEIIVLGWVYLQILIAIWEFIVEC